jgi:Xaa-Pro aminopeptidase
LNIRGSDIPFNPVVFSYVVVTLIDVFLFIDEKKLPLEAKQHLSHVKIFPYEKVEKFLQKYHSDCKNKFPKKHKVFLKSKIGVDLKLHASALAMAP